jgi:hypothetical protein
MKIIQNSPYGILYNSLLVVESILEIPLKLSPRDGWPHSFAWYKITFIFIFNLERGRSQSESNLVIWRGGRTL